MLEERKSAYQALFGAAERETDLAFLSPPPSSHFSTFSGTWEQNLILLERGVWDCCSFGRNYDFAFANKGGKLEEGKQSESKKKNHIHAFPNRSKNRFLKKIEFKFGTFF